MKRSSHSILRHARVKRFREVRRKSTNAEIELQFEPRHFNLNHVSCDKEEDVMKKDNILELNVLGNIVCKSTAHTRNNITIFNKSSSSCETTFDMNDNNNT